MKQSNKYSTNCFKVFLVLLAALAFGSGCAAPKPAPNPLAGWNFCCGDNPANLDKAIQADYKDYIQKLPPNERPFASFAHCFEDGTGRHAVLIEVPLNGTWWYHVLIYDANNKRIQTVKYSPGGYQS